MNPFRFLPALLATAVPVPSMAQAQAQPEPTYAERYRPQFHFTPEVNWMNDPNGLVYADGEYHLFYQHNPFGNTWGHMSWGHAVSPDLVHWKHLPVALPEADGVMAFSGSAVIDWENTSGFGQDGIPPMVAIYTGARPADGNQAQYVAYSNDRGRTWTKYAGNPVLDLDMKDFRDPSVFWYEPDEKWVMVLVRAAEHKVSFYASTDLKQWTHLSDFGPAGATGGVWECPALFELPVDGDPANTRWVLQVDLNPGFVYGGSGGQYFIGHFDGTTFIPDEPEALVPEPGSEELAPATRQAERVRWVDYGMDFYAAIPWNDVPVIDGRLIWLAWMNNWQYAEHIPTSPWRSAQSLPRTIALRTFEDGVHLVQHPVVELQRLRGRHHHLGTLSIREGTTSLAQEGIAGKALELVAEFEPGNARAFGLKVRVGEGEETVIGYDAKKGELFVDRTRSGDSSFHDAFAGRHAGPLPAVDGRVRFHVFVDWSSVEVFGTNGRTTITDRIFPNPESEGVALFSEGGTTRLMSLDAWTLKAIWNRPPERVGAAAGDTSP